MLKITCICLFFCVYSIFILSCVFWNYKDFKIWEIWSVDVSVYNLLKKEVKFYDGFSISFCFLMRVINFNIFMRVYGFLNCLFFLFW